MLKRRTSLLVVFSCLLLSACSPRDFLTRRLAADLIAGSNTFKVTQQFWLRTGVVSNQLYLSPEYLVLQRRGWITAANVPCGPEVAPPPCWNVALTPLGVGTFHDLIPSSAATSQYFSVPVARRQLVDITGITKEGSYADVDFTWKWLALNEVGAALYPRGVQYAASVAFKHYDDGWRVAEGATAKSNQGLEDALKNAEPVQ
jgi:hypothetical protein